MAEGGMGRSLVRLGLGLEQCGVLCRGQTAQPARQEAPSSGQPSGPIHPHLLSSMARLIASTNNRTTLKFTLKMAVAVRGDIVRARPAARIASKFRLQAAGGTLLFDGIFIGTFCGTT
jgi:hypothetical protein